MANTYGEPVCDNCGKSFFPSKENIENPDSEFLCISCKEEKFIEKLSNMGNCDNCGTKLDMPGNLCWDCNWINRVKETKI